MASALVIPHVALHQKPHSLFGPGAYLCVKGYGAAASTYALRAVYTHCPSDFTDDGKQMMCSSLVDAPESEKRYTGCSAEGVCDCKAPYQKPLPEVYDGKYLNHLPAASCTRKVGRCRKQYLCWPAFFIPDFTVSPYSCIVFATCYICQPDP